MGWDAGGEGCPDYNGGVLRDKLGAQIIMEGGCRRGGGAQIVMREAAGEERSPDYNGVGCRRRGMSKLQWWMVVGEDGNPDYNGGGVAGGEGCPDYNRGGGLWEPRF